MMSTKYTHGTDYKIFQMNFFIGYPPVIMHLTINKLFPPKGLGLEESFPDSDETAIEGPLGETGEEKEVEFVTAAKAKSDHGSV
jgi:hypothetical protein